MISTPTRGVGLGRKALVFLAGLALAGAGMLALAQGQAKANGSTPFTMSFDSGQTNLGFAFKGKEILPAPQTLPGTSTALPDLWQARATASLPDGTGTAPNGPTSFKPAGCITQVTFGLYAALQLDGDGNPIPAPGGLILDPRPSGVPFGGLLVNPLPNGGASLDPPGGRTLAKGAIVAGTVASNDETGLPPTNATLRADTAGFPNSGTLVVGGTEVTYTGKNSTDTAFTGVNGLPATVAKDTAIGLKIGSTVGPYPATEIKWIPLSVAALPPTSAPIPPGTQGPTANPAYTVDCATGNPAAGTVEGEIDAENNITIEPNGFRFPIMIVPNPLDESPVPITIATSGNLTGKLTPEGDLNLLDLEGPMEVRVLTGLASNPLGSYCALPLPNRQSDGTGSGPLKLTSGYSLPTSVGFNGTSFESISGPGALTGTWLVEDDSISVGGANCATVNSVSKGLGGIWLGAGVEDPAPYPTCTDLGKVGTFPNCVDPVARLANLKVTGPTKAKRGRQVTLKVTIRNTGNVPVTGVRFSAAGKGVRASSSVGQIAVGGARTETVKFRARKVGRVKVTFTVGTTNAGKKTATKTVRITR